MQPEKHTNVHMDTVTKVQISYYVTERRIELPNVLIVTSSWQPYPLDDCAMFP